MTLEELALRLKSTGLPVTYRAWPEGEAPVLPFLCYLCTDTDGIFADGGVYVSWENVRVELYTALKSPALEKTVEEALRGFHWKKSETYIDTERCYLILYEIEV